MLTTYEELLAKWESLNNLSDENEKIIESCAEKIRTNPHAFFSLQGEDLLSQLNKLRISHHPDKESLRNYKKIPHVYSGIIFNAINDTYKNYKLTQNSPTPPINSTAFTTLYSWITKNEKTDVVRSYFLENVSNLNEDNIIELQFHAMALGYFNLAIIFDAANDILAPKIISSNDSEIIIQNLNYAFFWEYREKGLERPTNRDEFLSEYRTKFKELPLNAKITFLYLSTEHESFEQFTNLFSQFNFKEISLTQLNQMGTSLLHTAAKSYMPLPLTADCSEKLKFLLSQDKNLTNLSDRQGNSPLHILIQAINAKFSPIASNFNEEPLLLLLSNGASIHFSTKKKFSTQKEGNTPLYLAVSTSSLDVLKTISQYWKDPKETDLLWDALSNIEVFEWLLSKLGSNSLTIKDEMDNSLLHKAVEIGAIKAIPFLLSQPLIDINTKNNLGQTPLHFIFHSNLYHEIYPLLIKTKKLDLRAKDQAEKIIVDHVFMPINSSLNDKRIKFLCENNLITSKNVVERIKNLYQSQQINATEVKKFNSYGIKLIQKKSSPKPVLKKIKTDEQKPLLFSANSANYWQPPSLNLVERLAEAIQKNQENDFNVLLQNPALQLQLKIATNVYNITNIIVTTNISLLDKFLVKFNQKERTNLLVESIKNQNISVIKKLVESCPEIVSSSPELVNSLVRAKPEIRQVFIDYQTAMVQQSQMNILANKN